MAEAMVATAIAVGLAAQGIGGSFRGSARWSAKLEEQLQLEVWEEVHALADVAGGAPCTLAFPATVCVRWRKGETVELWVSGCGELCADGRLRLALAGSMAITRGARTRRGTFAYAFEGERLSRSSPPPSSPSSATSCFITSAITTLA